MTKETNPIIEDTKYIVLDEYESQITNSNQYQSEGALEVEFIEDLLKQGYQYRQDIRTRDAMYMNLRERIQELNQVKFNDEEWKRLLDEYIDLSTDFIVDKTRKIHDNYIYDFTFNDGSIKNIYLLKKDCISKNKLEVINQFEQKGSFLNQYDVTILVNGLPLIHVELKKRGVAIREAFNQIHRYSKESFNSENSLYKYLQIFVISNGTDTKYFANTTKRNKNSFDFTINWADSKNRTINDLKDFTATFFDTNTLMNILLRYSVLDVSDNLLIMRPYQIAATERLLQKVKCSYMSKKYSKIESGGYIWHTTGSGKTLTSFKAARMLASDSEFNFIDKVLFVVDRKDLDYQTMKEYQKFSPDSVNGSNSTAGLKNNLEQKDNKIVVTTIQKLNNLMKSENDLEIYNKHVVFIFDEAHRSQFGEAQDNLRKRFKKYYQFGFTGTPIFPENASEAKTTKGVFGDILHSYLISDAIRDQKVLKFKIDYNDVRPKFKEFEQEKDEAKLTAAENKEALLHPDRINTISSYILDNFNIKTHRNNISSGGFNAIFAVSSIEAAQAYYESFKNLQTKCEKPLKIATIFSFSQNETQDAIGDIADESFNTENMKVSSKEFLTSAINDYNKYFSSNYSVETKSFQNYYKDLSFKVKNNEIDLLIVVGMFLTGFDAPTLNTLFVDKNLKYHGLIQAFSRTNRILDSTKTFGNIVTFRDLEENTQKAVKLFVNENDTILIEKSYTDYMYGFTDDVTKKERKGYVEIVRELQERYLNPNEIEGELDKKEFTKLFGQYLRTDNILRNYDEFMALRDFNRIDSNNESSLEELKNKYYLNEENIKEMQKTPFLSDRAVQDYKSVYNDICDWQRQEVGEAGKNQAHKGWTDVEFELDLIKSQEINLDYILKLTFENHGKTESRAMLIEEIRRVVRSSLSNRGKEDLIVEFIQQCNLDQIHNAVDMIPAFHKFAEEKRNIAIEELIKNENLNLDAANYYIYISLKNGFASEQGEDLKSALPRMSPMNPNYLPTKKRVFEKIKDLVKQFEGVGDEYKYNYSI